MRSDTCLHILNTDIELPERLNCPFYYQPHPLCLMAAEEVKMSVLGMDEWQEEISKGKMFGVLVVEKNGKIGYLKAYSGQICGREDWEDWVPAVFDYLQPDGYFITEEKCISAINREIAEKECSEEYSVLLERVAQKTDEGQRLVDDYRRFMAEAKAVRERLRRDGAGDEAKLQRESQFQKAELRRIRKALEAGLAPLREAVAQYEESINVLKEERRRRSDALQRWLFSHFVMRNGNGEEKNLMDIFSDFHSGKEGGEDVVIPPSGAGECCAPKLLQYALSHRYKPLAMAEFWWGESPVGELRRHLDFYPACQGKCKPILDFMLRGLDVEPNPLETADDVTTLDVVYEDDCLVVIDKPAGTLSVPGKGVRESAQDILKRQMGGDVELFCVHRLDMQTSGLLVFAKSVEVQRQMQAAFAQRRVKKCYVAVLDGEYSGQREGRISLPLSADYVNRPRQKVDRECGKYAVTDYIIEGTRDGKTFVRLFPHTGRTHQLRVHCAHPDGMDMPIVGDDLYGRHSRRLLLHAESLAFCHPITGCEVRLERKCKDVSF